MEVHESYLDVKVCRLKEGVQTVSIMAVILQTDAQAALYFLNVVRYPVGEFDVLQMSPDEFNGIKFRRVGREPSIAEPDASIAIKPGSGRRVDFPAIPDQDQSPAKMLMDLAKELHYVIGMNVVMGDAVVQAEALRPRSDRQGANHAEPIVALPRISHKRCADGAPSISPQRLQEEPAFVEKNDASLQIGPLFLAGATFPGAISQWLDRFPPLLGIRLDARSSRVDEAAFPHSPHGNPRRTGGKSTVSLAGSSTRRLETPKTAHQRSTPSANAFAGRRPTSDAVQDAPSPQAPVPHERRCYPANALPRTHWPRPLQPLPSPISLAPEAGLQYVDELPTLRDFLEVS